ncbi:hypothetical protein CFC21_075052 [Triticum aestivum]|uniref:Uncharacterized protein n=2 Tax=Triticum aestivum TaxID=4565 RepID=A0A3B6LY83_WHEAT|nr:putative F-box/kelch-repeat protein At3g17280 [Triticum dicoccoides]XP_037438836.1 putative F-box/kelch-repeat protein At3g17280 [Triticum dicoccoides]XP_044394412.1 putative F-box/kelch-repeat protein At3g17280 [Triticum aestivum]XP_044394413.1 putative F-box/kelch-repeat protein At3g17280 [Triticum aestivum]KAF7069419.1 hypothetical protein CFC21_075052 [Triticum aestivum]
MSRARSPPALDDDDLLPEILLRLPPQPSSLPRASLVCKRWRSVASDPAFSRRFRRHHRRNPPLLGLFRVEYNPHVELRFEPSLGAPNRISPERLSWRGNEDAGFYHPLGCRHGLVLILDTTQKQVLVWDPVTGDQHRVAIPPGFQLVRTLPSGAVLRGAAGDGDHFQVVLVGYGEEQIAQVLGCIYSSETGAWGDLISTSVRSKDIVASMDKPAVLVGDSLYWLLHPDGILEFDLDSKRLSVIPLPVELDLVSSSLLFSVIRADSGGLGFLLLSDFNAQLWERKTGSDGVTSWVLETTIEIDSLLPLDYAEEGGPPVILAYAEENNTALMLDVGHRGGLFMIQLKSFKFEKLLRNNNLDYFHLFESVYTAETCIGGGAGLLHST